MSIIIMRHIPGVKLCAEAGAVELQASAESPGSFVVNSRGQKSEALGWVGMEAFMDLGQGLVWELVREGGQE